jgi:transglutaminase-like putative cysteine protease
MRASLLLAPLYLACGAAIAANAFQAPITILNDVISYDVQSDGSYVMDEVETARINNEQGIKQRAQLPLPFSTSLQDLDVLEAYTTTPEGKRIDVTADKILLQQSPQSAGAPMFDDGKVKVVVFPAVEVGSALTVHLRKTQKKSLFPGQFSMMEVAWATTDVKSETVTVKAPESLVLHTEAVDMQGGRVATEGGRQVWRWTLHDMAARAPEPSAPGPLDYSPLVSVTTFADFDAAAAAYLERAQPKAKATPSIQKLADEITTGISEPRKQAEALYNWVAKNIRYVAIYLDFGGVVPHDADSIAAARYGDCKDHVALLEALLAAKGIKSSPVLVNSGGSYLLPKVAVTPGVFDHAITYLPQWNLFLDSTAGVATFGVLPVTEMGKYALVTDDGSGHARVMKLPVATPTTDRVEIETHLTIASDGTVKGTSHIENHGVFDWITRSLLGNIQIGMEPQVVSQVLAMSGQQGSGTFVHGDTHDLSSPFTYTTSFDLPNLIQLPGPGAVAIPAGFTSFSNIASSLEAFGQPSRGLPATYVGRDVSETTIITLPTNMKISMAPRGVMLANEFGKYSSTYHLDGQMLTIHRDLQINSPTGLLTVAQYKVMRELAVSVARDIRAQILYR